jgi:hypothetical protein
MIRAIASALAVASNTTSSLSTKLWANSSSVAGSVLMHPAERTHAVLSDRDLAEIAMHIHPDAAHLHPLISMTIAREAPDENDNYGFVLAAHPDTRGGGQLQIAGAQLIEAPACP